jgi:hypothetical protein
MRRLAVLLLALAGLALLPAAASAGPAVRVGIADNKVTKFFDPRFYATGIKDLRTTVPWDVFVVPAELKELDDYMRGARSIGAQVVLTIDRSPRQPSANPSPALMAALVKGLRARYPGQVRDLAAWNEPNINKKPELVARWWLAMQKACPRCRIMPGELVDRGNAISYALRVEKAAKRPAKFWGLHNYLDANRASTKATAEFVKAVKGEVWLTETGGVVARRNGSAVVFNGQGPVHAAQATRFVLTKLVALDRRITRVYLYNWDTNTEQVTWDSGFIGPDGKERPALAVLRQLAPGGVARGTTKALPVPKPKKAAPPKKAAAKKPRG